jgi:hypothetical protein
VSFYSFGSYDPVLNDAGQVAFPATLSDNGRGIWSNASGSLAPVVIAGDHAPGMPAGVNLAITGNLHVLNSAGQFADRFYIGNGKYGIWATDHNGVLQYIACEGELLEVAPGDFRTIETLHFSYAGLDETGNAEGRASPFNNRGQVAFSAKFTDGTVGVFVSNAVAHIPGDFDNDGVVDGADYVVWRKTGGSPTDYDSWRANFGQTLFAGSGAAGYPLGASAASLSAAVPEPKSGIMMLILAIFGAGCRPRPANQN